MKVLVLFCHPVDSSFNAALHATLVEALKKAGHEVDDCDLYAEGFQPVMSRQERINYHEVPLNRQPVESYIRRVEAAEAIVISSPVWNFGFPAMLKGFFDRVLIPGVAFDLVGDRLVPKLHHIRKVGMVTSYGSTRFRAFLMGDPPRKLVKRMLRGLIHPLGRCTFLALHDMDNVTHADRSAFLKKVETVFSRF